MYEDPEEARSDLLLAGAVFVFGPILLTLLLSIVPLLRVPGAAVVLSLAIPLLLTVAVPVSLARWRGDGPAAFGLTGDRSDLIVGVLFALPAVAMSLAAGVLAGGSLLSGLPVAGLAAPSGNVVLGLLARLLTWLGLAVLVLFAARKAGAAFRSETTSVPAGMARIGGIIAAVLFIAAGLRLLLTGLPSSLMLPLGVAGSVYLIWRGVRRPTATGFAVLLAPTVLLALGSFFLTLSPTRLVEGVWSAALVAALGLGMVALRESRPTAWAAVGLAATVALFTSVPLPLRLGL